MCAGFGLTVYSAALNLGDHIKLPLLVNGVERLLNHSNGLIETEIILQLFVVDLDLSFTLRQAYPSRCGFAPASSQIYGIRAHRLKKD